MIRVKGIWTHQDVVDKKLIVGEHKIKDISMGARITSITSHMKILLQKKEIIQNITELHSFRVRPSGASKVPIDVRKVEVSYNY